MAMSRYLGHEQFLSKPVSKHLLIIHENVNMTTRPESCLTPTFHGLAHRPGSGNGRFLSISHATLTLESNISIVPQGKCSIIQK